MNQCCSLKVTLRGQSPKLATTLFFRAVNWPWFEEFRINGHKCFLYLLSRRSALFMAPILGHNLVDENQFVKEI